MKIHPVVNISQVKPYKECLEGQPTFKPGPVQVTDDREIEFEVESIIDSRWKGRRLEYLVHWKGYSEEDRTWEPKGNLSNPENNGPDGWNVEEWDVQQQNPTWLDTGGMAVPDFIITALANIDHFREEAPAWLTLHIPVLTIPSEPKETAPQITEIPSENESEPENPCPDNEPIPSFQFNWPPDNIGHTESDS